MVTITVNGKQQITTPTEEAARRYFLWDMHNQRGDYIEATADNNKIIFAAENRGHYSWLIDSNGDSLKWL